MKQFETVDRTLGENTFYVRPFPAFVAANISGELFSAIMPMLGSIAPVATNALKDGSDLFDSEIDLDKAAPAITKGLSSLSGDRLESLLKKLLVKHKNISVQLEGQEKAVPLTESLANEIFCGDAQDMFILAVDVIKANYTGFFKRLGNLFGSQFADLRGLIQKREPGQKNTASST